MDTHHVFMKNILRPCVSLLSILVFEKCTHECGFTNHFDELRPAAECNVPLPSNVECYDVVAVQLDSMCDPCTQKIMKAFLRMFLVMFDAMSDTDQDVDAGSAQNALTGVTGMFDMMCAKDNEVFPAHHALCLCVNTRTHISTSTHAHTHTHRDSRPCV